MVVTTARFRTGSRLALVAALAVLFVVVAGACGSSSGASASDQSRVQHDELIVATTTSLNDSGLFDDVILPAYKKSFPDVTV